MNLLLLTHLACLVTLCSTMTPSHDLGLENERSRLAVPMLPCFSSQIMLVTDEVPKPAHRGLVDFSSLPRVPFMHFTVPENGSLDHLGASIFKQYKDKQQKHFIVISWRASEVVQSVEENYKLNATGSIFPHEAMFLLYTPVFQTYGVMRKLHTSQLDNIAIYSFNETPFFAHSLHTLMWRPGRKREFDLLFFKHTMPTTLCGIDLFPNSKNGLNGRELKVLTKTFLKQVCIQERNGTKEYVGYAVDILRVVAEILNFTISFTPKPTEVQIPNWKRFYHMMYQRRADIGVPFWGMSSSHRGTHRVSYTVVPNYIVGAYADRMKKDKILNPYERIVAMHTEHISLLTMIAGLGITFLYRAEQVIYDRCVRSSHPDMTMNTNQSRQKARREEMVTQGKAERPVSCTENPIVPGLFVGMKKRWVEKCWSKLGTSAMFSGRQCMNSNAKDCVAHSHELTDIKSERVSKLEQAKDPLSQRPTKTFNIPKCVSSTWDVAFHIFCGISNTSYLPTSSVMSQRIVIFSWCTWAFYVGVTIQGTHIAQMIAPHVKIPFKDFREVIADGDFRWVYIRDKFDTRRFGTKSNGTLLNEIRRGYVHFVEKDPSLDTESMAVLLTKMTEEPLVVIGSRNTIVEQSREMGIHDVVIIEEPLNIDNQGFAVPPNSELYYLLLDALYPLREGGFVDLSIRKWTSHEVPRKHDAGHDDPHAYQVMVMVIPLACVGFGFGSAVCVLMVEVLICKSILQPLHGFLHGLKRWVEDRTVALKIWCRIRTRQGWKRNGLSQRYLQ